MNAPEAAQKMAELINAIEGAGLRVAFSRSEICVDGVRIAVGQFEGDPWTVDLDSVPRSCGHT